MYTRKNFYMVILIILAMSVLVEAIESGNQKIIDKIHVSVQ